MKKEKIFKSFVEYANYINENRIFDEEKISIDKKINNKESEEDIVPRLDKEAVILAATDKSEEDLINLSDAEITAMYDKINKEFADKKIK